MQNDVTVVSWMKEGLGDTLRFVAWYLELGAAHIRLYLDDPNDPAIPFLREQSRVEIVRCTPEFWSSIGLSSSPDAPRHLNLQFHGSRQNSALTHGYRKTSSGWVLVVDADELLWLQGRTLSEFSCSIPPEHHVVTIEPVEAIRETLSPVLFRRMIEKNMLHSVYGDLAHVVSARNGLIGDEKGKSMIRAGMNFPKIRCNWPVDEKDEQITDLFMGVNEGVAVMHFFDRGPDSFTRRIARRGGNPFGRRMKRHIKSLLASTSNKECGILKLYRSLHDYDAARLTALKAAGGLFNPDIDFQSITQKHFPHCQVETSG